MEAAVPALESRQHDHSIGTEPEISEHTNDDHDPPVDAADLDCSDDGEDAWPALPVWIWLETDKHETWQANARLSPTDGVPAATAEAPVSSVGLIRLWLPVVKALRDLENGTTRTRTVPVWLRTEEDENGLVASFSFERMAGITAKQLDIPHDERSLTALRDGLGAAMIWLTGCESPDAAARELMKQPSSTLTPHGKPGIRVNRKPKTRTKKRAPNRSSERKMVLPRIRIVSGGAPGLGKRR
ncbi:hypothetical protein [Kribbella sp. CA-294648]|uniref:hypothetical protein n=1 Tax=Kribbella sp. CA-294648 TaxID=3239948 RepID=UPI003D8F3D6F